MLPRDALITIIVVAVILIILVAYLFNQRRSFRQVNLEECREGDIVYVCTPSQQYVGLSDTLDIFLTDANRAQPFTIKRSNGVVTLLAEKESFIPVVTDSGILLHNYNFEHVVCFNKSADAIRLESTQFDPHNKALFMVISRP